MATFDFINGEDFRLSLEADYRELNSAMQTQAWKTVHVLAGSIIETVLIDYLVASEYQKKFSSNPLKMTLAEAISACRQENALSEKTEHLSHVIRSYRNLIHPGRSVRLSEVANEQGAIIAKALIEIIIEEIAAQKKQNYGYTAEQIITKIEQDSTAIAILGHLLRDTNENEMERLLLRAIPKRYFELMSLEYRPEYLLSSLVTCYRLSFGTVSIETKEKAVKSFVKIIKEESSNIVWRYVFFRGEDIQYLSPEEASLIKQHFLSILKEPITDELLQAIEGIGKFLTLEEAISFVYPFINSVAQYEDAYVDGKLYPVKSVIQKFTEECFLMEIQQREKVEALLKNYYFENKSEGKEKLVKAEKALYEAITFIDLDNEIAPSDQFDPLADLEDHPF
jgi:ABC-type transporter Mla MlaB component